MPIWAQVIATIAAFVAVIVSVVSPVAVVSALKQMTTDLKESLTSIDERNLSEHIRLHERIDKEAEKRETGDKEIRENFVSIGSCHRSHCTHENQ